jgi:hypothetical protein
MPSKSSRTWKYVTPAVLCLSIGMATPLWYAVRAAGIVLLFAVASLIYNVISINADMEYERERKSSNTEASVEEKSPKERLAPLRFSAASFICAVSLLAPIVFRIVLGLGSKS